MHGKNAIYLTNLIYTNHADQRIEERGITRKEIEIAKKYGTELEDCNDHKVTIDFNACQFAADDGIDITSQYSLTIVVAKEGVLKTVYYRRD